MLTTARSAPDTTTNDGVLFIAADVSTAEGCMAVAQAVASPLGGVDVIVNVVGGSSAPGGGFAALDDDKWFEALNQNLMTSVGIGRVLLPLKSEQGSGVIVHVSSIQRQLRDRRGNRSDRVISKPRRDQRIRFAQRNGSHDA